jgi:hypothetical protein
VPEVKTSAATIEELINNWAGAVGNPLAFQIARRAIESALKPLSGGTESLLNSMDAVLKRMDRADMDLPHQSQRLRCLGETFASMKKKLIKMAEKKG